MPSDLNRSDVPPDDLSAFLNELQSLLAESRVDAAFQLLGKSNSASPWIINARGVCLLRSGKAKDAVALYRPLVVGPTGYLVRDGIPPVFVANYVSALLLAGMNQAAVAALGESRSLKHPAFERLRLELGRWRKSFSFWESINWYLGVPPDRPFTAQSPLGELR